MASGTSDLQRDLGGAIMQSTLGGLLTAGYTASWAATIASAPDAQSVSEQTQAALEKSFAGAVHVAESNPQYAEQIMSAARTAFLDGDDRAYAAAIVIVVLGALLVFFVYPKRDGEKELLAHYAEEDSLETAE